MGPPPAGDTAEFRRWVSEIERWRGEIDEYRRTNSHRVTEAHNRIDALDLKLDQVSQDVAITKTKVAFYAAVGSIVGGGIVTLIVAIASNALGS